MMYDICTNYVEIIAGTSNHYDKAYTEAFKNITASNAKSKKYIENFVKSIEDINKKGGKDPRIISTKGNIKSFQGYDNINNAIKFLTKNAPKVDGIKELTILKTSLEKLQPLYSEAYTKQIRVITLEYETALYMLVSGLALIIATNVDVVDSNNKIIVQEKTGTTHGIILKTCKSYARELSAPKHKDYLEGLIKINSDKSFTMKESTFTESAVGVVADTVNLLDNVCNHINTLVIAGRNVIATVKNTVFGIVPLIRCGLYIRYKKKADTILALEEQMVFIQQNIEKLEKRTNIEPEKKADIIKKQQAYIEAYRKKAEKLRAQLSETEKEAATEIAKDDSTIGDTSTSSNSSSNDDDDFILERTSVRHGFKRSDNERKEMFLKKYLKGNSFTANSDLNIDTKDKALADKALAEIKKSTARDSVCLKLGNRKDNDDTDALLKSKLGGTPYWPADMKWPKYKDKDMFLFAQLNFDEIPHIDGYPKTGIVQIFTADDQWYERMDSSYAKHYKVIYHEKPDVKVKQIESIPKSTCIKFDDDFPFTGVYYIDKFTKESISINICNENALDEIAMPIINKYFKSDWKSVWSINGDLGEYFVDALNDENHWGHRIGGWPSFTQGDMMNDKYNTLLLQIDSDSGKDIIWGDMGISNIFINDKSLKRNDFSDVLCTWDCY